MTIKHLHIADGLRLPAESFLESATGLLAKRGRGKTGGVKVILEELAAAHLPFVAIDPAGQLWGLRSSFDGKKPSGIEVLVIGGTNGDLPLNRKAGKLTAKAVADSDISVILDLKGEPKAAYREFVTDFLEELQRLNQVPRLLVIEEATRLVPQKLMDPGQTRAYAAAEELVTMGRNQGLGVLLVSQRTATISKDVLSQVDRLIVMGTLGPQDRRAVTAWVEANAEPEQLKRFTEGLTQLKPREAWIWDPDAGLFQQFRFRDFTTFHPDRTHLRRHGWLKVKPARASMQEVVDKLGADMQRLAEEVTREDPAVLHRRIAELERELRATPKPVARPVEVAAVAPAVAKRLEAAATQAQKAAQALTAAAADVLQGLQRASPARAVVTMTRPERPPPPAPRVANHVDHATGLSGPQQRILDALAWLESVGIPAADRVQLALLADASPSSSAYANNLGALRNEKQRNAWQPLITYTPAGVQLTPAGRRLANAPNRPPTVEDLHETLQQRLPAPQWRILQALIAAYPESLEKESLAAAAEASSTSSAYANNLGSLRSLGFIDYPARGTVIARPVLFLERPA